jgi:tetratricopeptide (TPR) repeat protein
VQASAGAAGPRLLPNRGGGGFAITTASPEAQAFFSNGMELAAAFDHAESVAAMAEAVRLDPSCAMCRWGHAYTLGPNLNNDRKMEERAEPYRVAVEARRLARAAATPMERALIEALIERFRPRGTVADRERAYFTAMKKVAADYPAHDEVQVLAADAAFGAGFGSEEMGYAIAVLEAVLARRPDHTPAIHFYIHATEVFGEPARAEAAADRLGAMELEANHLTHMPSHTWYWVGRYQDAADANRRAVQIGHGQTHGEAGEWDLPYHAHNVIFGLGGAMMAGDSRTALMLARPLVDHVEDLDSGDRGNPIGELLSAAGYFALGQFEDPQVVLALPEPKLPYLKAARHYARGEAYAFLGDAAGVREEIEAIPERIGGARGDTWIGPPDQMLVIARAVLRGRVATMEGRHEEAAAAFREAAEVEETRDFQRFRDPPAFWYPVRRDLARALWASGDREGALREAEKTLGIRPLDPGAVALIREIGEAAAASGG